MKNEKNTNNSTAHFRKDIGLFGGISLVAGMVIGSGIYYLGTTVLERSGMSMGAGIIVLDCRRHRLYTRRSLFCRAGRFHAGGRRSNGISEQSVSSPIRIY